MVKIDETLLDVDEQGILRISISLRLAVLYSFRYIALWLIAIVWLSSSQGLQQLLDQEFMWVGLVVEVPALFVFFVSFFRRRDAGRFARYIWSRGKFLFCFSVLGNVVVSVLLIFRSEFWNLWPELFLFSAVLLDLALLRWIVSSIYLSQVFDEFPGGVD